ncbi:MAG: amidohydrolase family protein [Gaiellaceae bacterium]
MTDVHHRAEKLLDRAYAATLELVPDGAKVFDAHVHVGDDIDGFYSRREELIAFLDKSDAAGAFFFCLDEPDREPAFTAANDRTLADAAASNGKLIPFVRLDLEDNPIEEARRALDRGARGIKLHPRAQRFSVGDDRLDPVFALSAEYGVPILIHAGRGMPEIADDLERLVSAHTGARLIVAHAGVADLERLTGHLSGRPGVFFDTAVFNFYDLVDLFGRVAPEQIVYASDYPYGQQPGSLYVVLQACALMGFSPEQTSGAIGGNALSLAAGAPPTPSKAPGLRELEYSVTLLRIHHYLTMAIPLLWSRLPDTIGVMGLAINTCQSDGAHKDELAEVSEYLACARDLWQVAAETENRDEAFTIARFVMRLLHIADIKVLALAE